jgi:hypothetical protein
MLLDQAKAQQEELGEAIERTQKELIYIQKRKPEMMKDRGVAEQVQQLELAKVAFEDRELSLAQLDEVLYLARSLEVQMIKEF